MAITITITPPPEGTNTLTVTHYRQIAIDFMKAINDVGTVIPPLDDADVNTRKFMRGHANIPDKFCLTALVAAEQVPELGAVNKLDIGTGHDTLQFLEAFRSALDTADAVIQDLRYRLMARKATLASQALLIYDIAKGLARDPRSAHVSAHVSDMRRDLGRAAVSAARRELRKAAKAAKAAAAEAQQKEVETS
jgi:hypothetical protein